MITNLNSHDPEYISAVGNYAMPYISPGSAGAGMMRWNPNLNKIEINDGCVWREMPGGEGIVMLSPKAKAIFRWAEEKMAEEQKLKEMIDQYPALKKAKENFDVVLNLVKDDFNAM